MDGVDHLVVIEAGFGRQGHAPGVFKLGANLGVVDFLIAREIVGHGAVVAGALHVVVAAQWIGSCSGSHVIAGDEEQVGDGGRGVGPHGVLSDAHRPENANAICLGDHMRDFGEGLDRETAALAGVFHREGVETLPIGFSVVHPLA